MTRHRAQVPRASGVCESCGRELPTAPGAKALLVAHVRSRPLRELPTAPGAKALLVAHVRSRPLLGCDATREPCPGAEDVMGATHVIALIHPSTLVARQHLILQDDAYWSEL